MSIFSKKEPTTSEKIAALFSEKERLALEVKRATKQRAEQKKLDLVVTNKLDGVIKELSALGIRQ